MPYSENTTPMYKLDFSIIDGPVQNVGYVQAIMYFAWRHLYWTAVVSGDSSKSVKQQQQLYSTTFDSERSVVLPLHVLVMKIMYNLDSIAHIMRTRVENHVVIIEALVAMTRKGGAIRFCALDDVVSSTEHDGEHAMIGRGLGVFFDAALGSKIFDAFYERCPIDTKSSFIIEKLLPVHMACSQAMIGKEVDLLFDACVNKEEALLSSQNREKEEKSLGQNTIDTPTQKGKEEEDNNNLTPVDDDDGEIANYVEEDALLL